MKRQSTPDERAQLMDAMAAVWEANLLYLKAMAMKEQAERRVRQAERRFVRLADARKQET